MARKDQKNFLRFVVVAKSIRQGKPATVVVRLRDAFADQASFNVVGVFRYKGPGNENDQKYTRYSVTTPGESRVVNGTGSDRERMQVFNIVVNSSAAIPLPIKIVVECSHGGKTYTQQSGRVLLMP